MKKNYIFTLLLVFYFSNLSFGQGSEVFTNSTATNSYADGSFVGEGDITWTFVKSRQASGNFNDTDITSMDLPALLLRRASDDSKITSNTISGGLADFSVKMYKGFTGGGNRQVELFVNGESKGTSEVFDDYTEHVFAVTGVNIAGDVVIELKNTTEKQVIIDEITWTAYDTTVVSNQVVLEDFEGTAPTVAGFEGLASATVSAGPVDSANTALELITSTTGQGWQGAELIMQSNLIDLSTDNTVKIDVYSTTAFTMFAKVEDKVNATASAASAADEAHTGSGWETLTFTFNEALDGTAAANGQYSQVAFFPNWSGSGWNDPIIDITVNIDNVTANAGDAVTVDTCSNGIQDGDETGIDCGGSCGPCPAEPTDAPTTPIARNDWDVISLYSDAYTSAGLTNVTWDDSEASEVSIASNNILKVDFGNFLGTELTTGGVDATNMTHFHMDYWVADDFAAGQVFNPKLSNHAASAGETGAKLYTVALGADDNKKWLSIDVELGADFERNNILQFLLTTSATVKAGYMDNIYMYRAATASVGDNELLNVSMYPNPASDRLNISAQGTIKSAAIYNLLGKKVMSLEINKNSESINVSGLASGMYLIKYSLDNAIGTAKFIKQ